jgi:hypothetical protein
MLNRLQQANANLCRLHAAAERVLMQHPGVDDPDQ